MDLLHSQFFEHERFQIGIEECLVVKSELYVRDVVEDDVVRGRTELEYPCGRDVTVFENREHLVVRREDDTVCAKAVARNQKCFRLQESLPDPSVTSAREAKAGVDETGMNTFAPDQAFNDHLHS